MIQLVVFKDDCEAVQNIPVHEATDYNIIVRQMIKNIDKKYEL